LYPARYSVKRDPDGQPAINQGEVHGHPVTFNPDDGRFYIHAPGTTDGTNVLSAQREFRNAVQFARRQAAAGKGG
jgi:hypothetical protein